MTLFIQSVMSARQRRHERQGRAFDTRLQVYADYLHHTEEFTRVCAQMQELTQKIRESREAIEAGIAAEEVKRAEQLIEDSKPLREAGTRYMEELGVLRSRISILGDPPTVSASHAIMIRVADQEQPTALERKDFIDAARRELALDRSGWPTRVWRRIERSVAKAGEKRAAKKRKPPSGDTAPKPPAAHGAGS